MEIAMQLEYFDYFDVEKFVTLENEYAHALFIQ